MKSEEEHAKDPNAQCLPPGPTWLGGAGHEHSDKMHLTERFRLADPDTLEFIVAYDDPVFFVKPLTSKKVLKGQIGDYIYDHACQENEKIWRISCQQ